VYLNWLLSAEGQGIWSRAVHLPSLRRDVSKEHVPAVHVLKDGVQYMDAYSDNYSPRADQVSTFMEGALAARGR
jgi:hypothetical protein